MKEGWEYKKLGEVATIINGKNQKAVEDNNGIYPICGSGGIMGYANDFLCPEQTVIIGRKGNINRPIYMEQKFWNVDTAFGIVANKTLLHPKYLYYFCEDFNFERLNKAVTIPSLVKSDLLKINISVPPLSEQQQIVEELDLLSSIIEKKKAQLNELDNLAQSLFYEMFGDISTGTNILSDFCKIIGGKRIPKGLSFSDHITAHPYLRATDMKNGTILKGDIKYIDNCVFEKIKRYIITKDDVYLTNVGVNLGMAGVIPDEFDNANLTENAVKLVFDKNKIDKYFLSAYLNSNIIQSEIQKRKMTVGVPKLAIFRIQTLPFVLPPLNLQQQFASKIEAIEHQKELIKQSIKEVETLFNSRMDYYFN